MTDPADTPKKPRPKPVKRRLRNIYERDGKYQVSVMVEGRRVRETFDTVNAAQTRLGQIREDAMRNKLGVGKKSRATLDEWAPEYLKWAKVHKKSWERDERSLIPLRKHLGHFKLGDIGNQRITAYQNDRLKEDVQGPTVNREVACLRKLMSVAVQQGELDHSPLQRVEMLDESPARQPILEAAEEKKLLEACSPPWLRLLVHLAISTGCRQGELLALRWKHADLNSETPHFVIENSKSGESRRVVIATALAAELEKMRKEPNDLVVLDGEGESPTPNAVVQAFHRARRKANKPGMRFHDLRHIAGSRLLAAGASLPEIADWLGHKTLHIARRYAHTKEPRLRELVNTKDPVQKQPKHEPPEYEI